MHSNIHMPSFMDGEEGQCANPIILSVFNNDSSDSDSD